MCEACNFLIYGGLIGKVDGCPMGGPISVVLSNRFRVKMEFDIVKHLNLYKPFVDDVYSKHIENEPPEDIYISIF